MRRFGYHAVCYMLYELHISIILHRLLEFLALLLHVDNTRCLYDHTSGQYRQIC